MAKKKEGPQPETRAERRERLENREYIGLTRREERAIVAAEQNLERVNADLEYDEETDDD